MAMGTPTLIGKREQIEEEKWGQDLLPPNSFSHRCYFLKHILLPKFHLSICFQKVQLAILLNPLFVDWVAVQGEGEVSEIVPTGSVLGFMFP